MKAIVLFFMLKLILTGLLTMSLVSPTYAEPTEKIEMITPEMQSELDIRTQDIPFEGKQYRLFIAAPKKQNTSEKLPVLYLLDGNAQFSMAVNLLNLSKKRPLVVGIGYAADKAYDIEQRTRDYTYPAIGKEFANGGGAADFLRFIQQEVKPYVAKHYAVDFTEQHFFGHSFGGLFGLYVLLNQPDEFTTYTLASPSLWWGNAAIIPQTQPWLKTAPKQISIVLGEYEESPQNDPAITPERLAKVQSRQAVYPTRKFADELAKQGYNTTFEVIAKKDHGGVIREAIRMAVGQVQVVK